MNVPKGKEFVAKIYAPITDIRGVLTVQRRVARLGEVAPNERVDVDELRFGVASTSERKFLLRLAGEDRDERLRRAVANDVIS